VITVGNLKSKRDFTDVRDIVRAYWLALQKGEPGEVYNICSDKAVSIQEVLDKFLKLSKKEIKIEQDVERLRPADVPLLLGDATKFREKTGWEPGISFEKTLQDTLDYWLNRIYL
jgi:GDP-4-dehydro-6-deoxy-D-mannose reductase